MKPNTELLAVLELVRCKFGKPVTVTSGYRCKDHNIAVGGAVNSQHKLGTAADIVVEGITPVDVYDFLDSVFPNNYGLGKYDDFTHVDVRPSKGRW